jgi:lactoylglutathione lyase
MVNPVIELRVALTTQDYETLLAFYTDALGLEPGGLWTTGEGRAVIFDLGQATLEVLNQPQTDLVDQIEAGQTGLSGQIRFALRVPDLDAALQRLTAKGSMLLHEPVVTPWRHYNARLKAPDGMQITLFQILDAE